MKNLIATTLFLLLCAVFAWGQTSSTSSNPSSTSSGTQTQTTPDQTSQQPSSSSTPSSSQSGTSATGTQSTTSGAQDTMGTQTASKADKGTKEKSITGCLESAGTSGQYTIKHRNKDIAVMPSDTLKSEIGNHVGHKVKLYGSWEKGAAGTETAMAQPSGSNLPQSSQPGGGTSTKAGKENREFRADRIDMISDTCGGKSSSKSQTPTTTPKP